RYPSEGAPDNANTGGTGRICRSCTGGINTILGQYMGAVPEDPSHDGSNYYYYYDGRQTCGGNPVQAVVAAHNMENPNNSNTNDTKCTSWGGEGGIGQNDSYNVVLGDAY
ncbi:hypothetical protein KC722_02480, partial [Candidatus Kaiserbacteria bacterium]|nr:hypothetical protein [Candidatus Kaiserbacteria bacterium]